MSQTTTGFEILRKNQTEAITIFVRDPTTGDLTNVIGNSTFNLINTDDDTNVTTSTFPPTGNAVIANPLTGIYQYTFNSTTYDREYLAEFRCLLPSEVIINNLFIKSVSSRHFKYVSVLRNQIDKAQKSVYDDIENMDKPNAQPAVKLLYGYDDKGLIYFLEKGMQIINAVPPYTGFSVDTFPFDQFGSIMIDAATIAALEAQGIFSIDTDFNYSLGGNSLVIDHYTKLNSFLSSLLQRFDKSLVSYKQKYRSKGIVLFQFMPGGVRASRMLNAQPAGWWSRLLSSMSM